jgi:hypothetical protein
MFKSLILGLVLFAQTIAPATMSVSSAGTFIVKFQAGVEWACTVFRMTEPTESNLEIWPDGHYAPRTCGPVDPKSTFFTESWSPYIYDPQTGKDYNVEWDVYTILQYPEKGRTDAFTEVETNRLRIKK